MINRAFIAVVLPDDVLDSIEFQIRPIEGLRFSAREKWHITLAFCGRIEDEQAMTEALRPVVEKHANFALKLSGAGVFPKPQRANVFWCGVTGETDELSQLAMDVRAEAEPFSEHHEDREFRSHVTIGRARRSVNLRNEIERWEGWETPEFTVSEIVLISSEGERYDTVATLPLHR